MAIETRVKRWVPAVLAGVTSVVGVGLGIAAGVATSQLSNGWAKDHQSWIWFVVGLLTVATGVLAVMATRSPSGSDSSEDCRAFLDLGVLIGSGKVAMPVASGQEDTGLEELLASLRRTRAPESEVHRIQRIKQRINNKAEVGTSIKAELEAFGYAVEKSVSSAKRRASVREGQWLMFGKLLMNVLVARMSREPGFGDPERRALLETTGTVGFSSDGEVSRLVREHVEATDEDGHASVERVNMILSSCYALV